MKSNEQGVMLVEIILAIAVLAIITTLVAETSIVSFRSADTSRERSQASELAKEGLEAVRAIRDFDDPAGSPATQGWNRIYCPAIGDFSLCGTKNISTAYYPLVSSGKWILTVTAANGDIVVGNTTYTRKVFIENVCRSTAGDITTVSPCGGGDTDDPSTQKITVRVTKQNQSDVLAEVTDYLSRSRNDVCPQTNWDADPSSTTLPSSAANCFTNTKYESKTNIDTTVTSGSLKLSQ